MTRLLKNHPFRCWLIFAVLSWLLFLGFEPQKHTQSDWDIGSKLMVWDLTRWKFLLSQEAKAQGKSLTRSGIWKPSNYQTVTDSTDTLYHQTRIGGELMFYDSSAAHTG
jgi:hypothetical protein